MNAFLYIKQVKGKGRGVFCKQHIRKDHVFETAAVIILPARDYEAVTSSHLADYFFNFDKDAGTLALVLGFGSLYNHAVYSNAAYSLNKETRTMSYYALEDIPPGTEICINYAGEQGREFKEWFEARDIDYKDS
ncbi:MAG: SET domain-containing protein-lysine N-methyltransferase [Chitinophagaceae bacterium]|nr:SET domain-containing protein-lysine N-methyltransferase [Chitinophagaceae bacterium]